MNDLPGALLTELSVILKTQIRQVRTVGGGDINEARLMETGRGAFFLKYNRLPEAAAMFATEARGLAMLRDAGTRAPAVIRHGAAGNVAFLLLEYIRPAEKNDRFWEDFGAMLARQHAFPYPFFGLPFDNYIGSLRQPNGRFAGFVDLFVENRLKNQLAQAISQGRLNAVDEKMFEKLYRKLPDLLPDEPPALIHGDLWSGNFLTGGSGFALLIDPAVAWAHREMDLAMSRLFGGFAPRFYESYQANYPLEPGFSERLEIYQLYYLLVHVNLFGGSYSQSVRNILKRFAG